MPTLSVIIPTYNRNLVLRENLAKLLPQITAACRVVIIDNHSSTPVEETLRDLFATYPSNDISIVRNRRNIGGNANILRCFELCESEWLWVLGDDDCPKDDAIELALRTIGEAPNNCIYQNFATPGKYVRRETYESLPGLEEFLGRIDDLGNCMLISSCLFRVGVMGPEVQHGFTYASTMMPHLLVTMLAIKRLRARARFHSAALVTHGDAEGGGRHYVILGHLGFGLLGSLPIFNDRERRLLRSKMASLLSAKALVAHIAFGKLAGEISYREARLLISRCAAEMHYRTTDRIFLALCHYADFVVFSEMGCRVITIAVNWLQKGKSVRVQHVSHENM